MGGWYGLKKGYRGRFGMYVPPVLEALGLAEVEHQPRKPVNTDLRHVTGRGFIGSTSGPVNRPPGEWQVCFRATDGTRATPPITFFVL